MLSPLVRSDAPAFAPVLAPELPSVTPFIAAEVSDPVRPHSGVGRFGANNIWGVSQCMLGNYENVIDTFTDAPNAGGPISAPGLVFLAVAYDYAGDTESASRLVDELMETWPDLRVEFLVERIFRNAPAHRIDILERLSRNGYQANE